MLGIILIIIFIVLIITGILRGHWFVAKKAKNDFGGYFSYGNIPEVWIGWLGLLASAMIMITIYCNLISYEADFTVLNNKVKLAEERNQNSVEQLKFEAQKYVNYEEDIFKNLKPENATILFNAYPNLRTIEAVRYLMEQITRFNDETFKLKLSKEEIRASLLSISNNIFIPFSSKLIND